MKGLALAAAAVALSWCAPSFAEHQGGSPFGEPGMRPAPPRFAPQRIAPPRFAVHPGWRPGWRVGHFVNHRHFRFRGRTFVFIGAPLFAAPWSYYPYVWDAQYGPAYYDPAQPGYFLFYCPEPAGYYPEIAVCPAGWYPVVPGDPGDGDY
jgi:hypothetical protein